MTDIDEASEVKEKQKKDTFIQVLSNNHFSKFLFTMFTIQTMTSQINIIR